MPSSRPSQLAVFGRILISGIASLSIVTATAVNASAVLEAPDLSGAEVARADEGSVMQVLPADPIKPAASAKGSFVPALSKAFDASGIGELAVEKTFSVGAGSTVRLKQLISGVPVFGASIAQSLAKDGSLISASGATAKSFSGDFPADEAAARERAKAAAIAEVTEKFSAANPTVASLEPQWYDPTLIKRGSTEPSVAVPAYKVALDKGIGGSWLVFIAADQGKVLNSWSRTATFSSRVICDANRFALSGEDVECGAAPALFRESRVDGQKPVANQDVNNTFDFFGDTQRFYAANTGADDLAALIGGTGSAKLPNGDSYGKALRAVNNICLAGVPNQCQFPYGQWNSTTQTVILAPGMAVDDVIGHELTHGVTVETSDLVYENQSGAINESMSDIFGEFVDLTNGSADDTAQNRWKIAEGSAFGVFRDMKSPPSFKQPDWMGSALYDWKDQMVHTNSGVGNKTAYLITDGGEFRGQNVQGIGIKKSAQLYWTVQTLLPSNADYEFLGAALKAACQQNTINKVAGTTKADCEQVAKAAVSTGISK